MANEKEGNSDDSNPNKELNNTIKIFQNEFTSIFFSLGRNFIKPLTKRNKKLDDVLEQAYSDVLWKMKDFDFEKIPYQVKDAYKRLSDFIQTIYDSYPAELPWHAEALDAVRLLSQMCYDIEDDICHYSGRNPCRIYQYHLIGSMEIVRKNIGESDLYNSIKSLSDICKKCPHK